ncbi:MAG: EAL domain-containing protein [Glaciimonas sp.]|nr:EAL domain-containing protein [Glaciimonas sp.]
MQLWRNAGLYTRLLLPILLLILSVNVVQGYLILEYAKSDAQVNYQEELHEMQRDLVPALAEQAVIGDVGAISRLLQSQVRERADLGWVQWQHQLNLLQVIDLGSRTALLAPAWFVRLLAIPAPEIAAPIMLGGEYYGVLRLRITPVPVMNKIWRRFLDWGKIFSGFIVAVFLLINLILRSNLAAIRQLSVAVKRFRAGNYSVRVPASGSHETRGMASAFNGMAAELEALLQSLEESNSTQSEQLHFNQQLLAALPIPLYFKDTDGVCLGVNTAWENLYGFSTDEIVGHSVQDVFPILPGFAAHHLKMDAELFQHPGRQTYEITIPAANGILRDVIYYKATYTNVEGSVAGLIGAIVDITERKQAQAALQAEKERALVTLASIGDAVITTDLDGRVESLNGVAQQLTGWSVSAAQGLPLEAVFNILNEDTRQPATNFISSAALGNASTVLANLILMGRDGKECSIECSVAPIRNPEGTLFGCVLVFRDVSEKRHLLSQITWQASHDALTKLPNRVLLGDRFKQAIASAQRHQQLLAVCLLDLDGFKPVNDYYGHELGDRLLIELAGRLSSALRGEDTVARLGGDEFVLLLSGLNDIHEIGLAMQRILAKVAEPYLLDGQPIQVSASIGVAVYSQDEIDPDTLLRHADQAMYQAKQAGRSRYHFFDTNQDHQAQSQQHQLNRIRRALQQGELRLYYQPKVDMRRGQVVGMEALLRWHHPERGVIGPLDFLPLVEQTDLIVDIGEWVLHEALRQMAQWAEIGVNWVISVNIAAHHYERPDFLARLEHILADHPTVSPSLLELEILESAALGDIIYVRNLITACHALGVTFALDDFGTGYSSLTYLKRLPADVLKIDQSFVLGMLDDQADLALVKAVISLAAVFNRTVIAEGMETAEHGMLLMQLGCDLAQGYGIARPMPASDVVAWSQQYRPAPLWAEWADITLDDNDFPLLVAQYDHQKWVKQVIGSSEGQCMLSFSELKDHHSCRFGLWYDGHGSTHYGHLPEFSGLEALHASVHDIGPKIVRLNSAGQFAAAKALEPGLLVMQEEMRLQLASLQRAVAKLRLETQSE